MDSSEAIQQLARFGEAYDTGEVPSLAEIEEMMSEIQCSAERWSVADGRLVHGAVQTFISSISMAKTIVHEELRELRDKEQGVKGYGHIRSFQRGQKLFRKA